MKVVMTSNLFAKSRHYGVLLPDGGESVALPEDAAKELIASGHAKAFADVEAEVNAAALAKAIVENGTLENAQAEVPVPAETADQSDDDAVIPVEQANTETPENAAEKRGPGRPRKAAE